MQHNVTPELAAAFAKRVAAMGYSTQPTTDNKLLFTVCRQGMEVCQFEKSGAQRYYPDMPLVYDRIALIRLMSEMKQAHDLYADAPPFDAVESEGFHLISAFGKAVLAAKLSADNEIRFVTWEYTYDRTAVTMGHYYDTNYEGAKKDFALRAGLLDANQIFTEDELKILYAAAVYRGGNDNSLHYDDEKALRSVIDKLEENNAHSGTKFSQAEQTRSVGVAKTNFRTLDLQKCLERINAQDNFLIVDVDEEGCLSFSATSEFDHEYAINYSDRFGSINESEGASLNVLDVFYSDEFQADGSLAYYNDFTKKNPDASISDMLQKSINFENYTYIEADRVPNAKEVASFGKGGYLIIFQKEKAEGYEEQVFADMQLSDLEV